MKNKTNIAHYLYSYYTNRNFIYFGKYSNFSCDHPRIFRAMYYELLKKYYAKK